MSPDPAAAAPSELGPKLVFRGGHAQGPNGRFGAWVVSVDAAGVMTIVGQTLGREVRHGPAPLSEVEQAALDALLDEASTAVAPSQRMGVPDESMLAFEFEARGGRHTLFLWHREALGRPPFARLLRWLDDAIVARTGQTAAFKS